MEDKGIEEFIREFEEGGGSREGVSILKRAFAIFKDDVDLEEARRWARRDIEIAHEDLSLLFMQSLKVCKESPEYIYGLMELIQAASVSTSRINDRNQFSATLFDFSLYTERPHRARFAARDCYEDINILARFFEADEEWVEKMRSGISDGWKYLQKEVGLDCELFEPEGDAAEEWMELLLWNMDFGTSHGLLSQIDATLRLAMRFEYYSKTHKGSFKAEVGKMVRLCNSLTPEGDPLLHARCLVTIGDALVESKRLEEAIGVYRELLELDDPAMPHPIWLHGAIQLAYSYLLTNEVDLCRRVLEKINRERMESLAESVLTVSAEYARFLSVESLMKRRRGETMKNDVIVKIKELVGDVGIIRSLKDSRTGYMQNLFFAVMHRDITEMLETG